jgi:nucleotide-binding universal stress UspA family protein
MKILCGTDFSQQAERASRAALQLARRFGDTLILAQVLEPPTSNLLEVAADARAFEQTVRGATGKALDDAAAALRSYGVSVETVILTGHPHEALTTLGREIDARLIVLGSHGRHAPWRWFVGSVAERTQRLADRPVLIVREHAEGIGGWAAGRRPLRVVVGIDMSEASHAPVAFVKALRKQGPCKIDFVHVSRPFAFAPAGDVLSLLDRALREQVGELQKAGDCSLRIVPNWNTDADTLAQFVGGEKADLLIVGTHQRRGLDLMVTGSVAREMIRLSDAPVLTVPTVRRIEQTTETRPVLTIVAGSAAAVPLAFAIARPGGTVVLCGGDLRALVPTDAFARGVRVEVRDSADAFAVAHEVHPDLIVTASAKGKIECVFPTS